METSHYFQHTILHVATYYALSMLLCAIFALTNAPYLHPLCVLCAHYASTLRPLYTHYGPGVHTFYIHCAPSGHPLCALLHTGHAPFTLQPTNNVPPILLTACC